MGGSTKLCDMVEELSSLACHPSDNPNTTQTPECTKDEYNVKIIK
jgi:hypothetical protein